jgi:hypothetical protein
MSMRSTVSIHIGGKFDLGKLEYLAGLAEGLQLGVNGNTNQTKEELMKFFQTEDGKSSLLLTGTETDYSDVQGLADDLKQHKIPFCIDVHASSDGGGERMIWMGRFKRIRSWFMIDAEDGELLIGLTQLKEFHDKKKTLKDVMQYLDQFEATIPVFTVVTSPLQVVKN